MLRKAGVVIEENSTVLPEFFVYRCVTPPETLFKNICQLAIGGKLDIAIIEERCVVESGHIYNPLVGMSTIIPEFASIDEIVERIYSDFVRSVNLLSPCRDRLSVLLSGGLDSSIVYAVCKNLYDIKDSYSTIFPFENLVDDVEKKYALSAAEFFNSEHCLFQTDTNKYLYGFLESISTAEEPLHHLQSVLLYLLFKHGIPGNRNVIVSGEGADGIFGMSWHHWIHRWNRRKAVYKPLSMEPLFHLIKLVSRITNRGYGFVNTINAGKGINRRLDDPRNIMYSYTNYGSEDWVCDYFNVNRKNIIENKYESIRQFENNSIYDIFTVMDIITDISITKSIWSKLSEGSNKIMYYPFYNTKLLQNALSIKWETKLKEPKYILRRIAKDLHVADFIIERPKSGFGITPSKWATKGSVFEPLVPLASKCFDKSIIAHFQSIKPKSAMTFWNILNYSIWKRLCIDNEPLDVLSEELSRSISNHDH
jgi:asparagine synthetase B (glutamine-hydrolysing)